jgi:formylglycine-generating enzyme required for sulfatase activity
MFRIIAVCLFGVLWVDAAQANRAPVVSNVQARQQSGTLLVDITYDVFDADGDTLMISVQISDDGGQTFRVPAQTFEGDVGSGITSGTGKQVVWDAGVDVPDVYGTDFRPKVIADDGQGIIATGEGIITVDLPGGSAMEFVWIEPGTFTMGSPDSEPGRYSAEGPQHEVTISQGFYLGKFEITQGQWEAVMGATPWSGQSYVQLNPNHPAVYISWDDMQEFIQRLNEAAGEELYRLPTEAEWEYAVRAGTTTRWSFGDDEGQLGDYAWYYDNAWNAGLQYAQPVGTKLPNPWGLYDMHGNVWEWCQDWWGEKYYRSSPSIDPLGPATGSLRVLRGGHFGRDAQVVRSADRRRFSPDRRLNSLGARLLRTR